jgi:DNA-directed RNA polymerase subunit beta'
VIIRNEKRMLQQVVDALFDNGRCKRPIMSSGNRQLKSLTDMIKGKQGRFRENLLGKRVDYSARSVIVVGPELKLHQCGLPKYIALELFQPFIIRRLRELGLADTIKSAKKMLDRRDEKIWDILDEVIKKHPVMLNRAPTLHRMGIQAFEPVLVEGNAIKIHPLVCAGFNADFDGDTMSVHLPLTVEAQAEARMLMMSTRNILSPAHGKPIIGPSQDIVLGVYYLTLPCEGEAGEGKLFSDSTEALRMHADGKVGIHATVGVRITDRKVVGDDGDEGEGVVWTTAGRIIFNDILPEGMPFYNKLLDKGALSNIIHDCYETKGPMETIALLDGIKELGFKCATLSGLSFAATDLRIPPAKKAILEDAEKTVEKIERAYRNGVITAGERHNQILDAWTHANEVLGEELMKTLKTDTREGESYLNPVYLMAASGARGGMAQLRQLAGMRGLMTKPSGEIIETPILSNFREGIDVLDYFSSTHGARKGLADTALKTADSGYLTRKLIDVSQNVVLGIDDCGTLNGITKGVSDLDESSGLTLKDLISGRTARDTIVDVVTDQVVVEENDQITPEKAISVENLGYEKVRVRSPLTCEAPFGICAKCYGTDLSTGRVAELGLAAGIIAAQSIGEPGTQLTMRTFHIGGTASRALEESQIKAGESGVIAFYTMNLVVDPDGRRAILNRGAELGVLDHRGRELERHACPVGANVLVQEGQTVKKGQLLVQWDPHMFPILTEKAGIVRFEDIVAGETVSEETDRGTGVKRLVVVEHKGDLHPQLVIEDDGGNKLGVYPIPEKAVIEVEDGKAVAAGTMLAKTPREIRGTQDITGGLPRVTELFEARKPKDPAIMSEIDGTVEIGERKRGKITIRVHSDSGMVSEHLVPRGKHLRITTGDRVKAGEPLVDGPLVLQDILQINGEESVQQYLLREIQSVYRSQTVSIDDKHIELIIRQMMGSVQVSDSGSTKLLPNDIVDRMKFKMENEEARKEKRKPAKAEPILLGITKAALRSDSFIAAASFQQTTKVLTEAALAGRTDRLQGLKENVILGRLVPVGTGFRPYWEADLKVPGLEELLGGKPDEDTDDSDVKEEVA